MVFVTRNTNIIYIFFCIVKFWIWVSWVIHNITYVVLNNRISHIFYLTKWYKMVLWIIAVCSADWIHYKVVQNGPLNYSSMFCWLNDTVFIVCHLKWVLHFMEHIFLCALHLIFKYFLICFDDAYTIFALNWLDLVMALVKTNPAGECLCGVIYCPCIVKVNIVLYF